MIFTRKRKYINKAHNKMHQYPNISYMTKILELNETPLIYEKHLHSKVRDAIVYVL